MEDLPVRQWRNLSGPGQLRAFAAR